MACFVFDLLMEGGEEVTGLRLTERKGGWRRSSGAGRGALVYSDHVQSSSAETVFSESCRAGHEGFIAKPSPDAPYRYGSRPRTGSKVNARGARSS